MRFLHVKNIHEEPIIQPLNNQFLNQIYLVNCTNAECQMLTIR